MKKQFIILPLALALGGCASLTKTQIEAVNQFSLTSINFSDYPSKIITGLAETRMKRGVYFANSLDDAQLHLDELDSLYSNKKSDFDVSAKVDITFKVIDKYAQSLLLLSSDKFAADLDKQAKNFGVDLDSLLTKYNSLGGVKRVPAGIGGAVSQLVALGGKQYVRSKQATEIKKFVPQADTLIAVMTANLLEFLESTNIQLLIQNEESGVNSNYLSFLRQRKPTLQNERDYLELKNNIDAVKKLRDQTVAATRDLRGAHKKLLTTIQAKKTLRETITELQNLFDEVKEMKATISHIETAKN